MGFSYVTDGIFRHRKKKIPTGIIRTDGYFFLCHWWVFPTSETENSDRHRRNWRIFTPMPLKGGIFRHEKQKNPTDIRTGGFFLCHWWNFPSSKTENPDRYRRNWWIFTPMPLKGGIFRHQKQKIPTDFVRTDGLFLQRVWPHIETTNLCILILKYVKSQKKNVITTAHSTNFAYSVMKWIYKFRSTVPLKVHIPIHAWM